MLRSSSTASPAAVLIFASVAAVGAWSYPGDLPPWRTLGIVSAWCGSALLAACLVLMVREPWLARGLGGLDSMYRWHHRAGVLGYVMLLVHPLALAAEGLADDPRRSWQMLDPTQQSWPVWTGWLALLMLMLGLAGTFDRRLAYRRWLGWHQLLGFGALAGWLHVFALVGNQWMAVIGAGLAAAALAWRFVAVDGGLSAHLHRVAEVHVVAPGVIEARLAPLAGAAMRVMPGQFVLARFVDGAAYRACGEFHPFTVSGVGPDDTLRVTIKALGPCSTRIQGITTGLIVRLQGPFGDFLAHRDDGPQLWVAGGIGITPFIAALREHPPRSPTTLIHLHPRASEAAFRDELEALSAAGTPFDFIPVETGNALPEIDPLLDRVTALDARTVQVCGPESLVASLKARLAQRGVPAHKIHHESFEFR